jgi:hypothetical protein
VELAAARRADVLGELDADDGWDRDRWSAALDRYYAEHASIGIDAAARSADFFELDETGRRWQARQVLDDPAGERAWLIRVEVDLDASDEAGRAVIRILDVGER